MSPDAALLAAAGVGFGHAVLPDHWVPLAVLARTQRYPLRRVAKLSTAAAAAHVAVSLILGAIIIVVGLQLRSTVQSAQDAIVGTLLIATGVVFLVLELTGRGHQHDHDHDHDHHGHGHDHDDGHDADHDHDHPQRSPRLLAVLVPFGAAASPDLTILPVFLAATAAGAPTAVGALLAFAVVTIATMLTLTLLATAGGYGLRGRWLDRWGNRFTAGVLIVIGALVLAGVL